MGYDVLSEDVFDDSRRKPSKKKKSSGFSIKPIYIHAGLILIIVLALFFFFWGDFSLTSKAEDSKGEVKLVGEILKFNESYSGDLSLYSANFLLDTGSGTFDESARDVLINGFNGTIVLDNNSIVFLGKADSIEFGKNKLTLKSSSFTLISKKKTRLNLFMKSLNLSFVEGNLKLDDSLSYSFKKTNVDFERFNMTMTYDGSFTFVGKANQFRVVSPEGVSIAYKK